jgi:ubiquinone/menaquinone biosynthesis C-methylase UbiE
LSLIQWTPKLYSKISKHYDFLYRLLFPIGNKGHEAVLEGLDQGTILDVACGTGILLSKASRFGMVCYGLDNSEGMLVEAKGKSPEAEFRLASFYEIPFSDGTFDYVVETNAVSGVDIEVEKVLLEMVRVCKIGGEIRIGDYARPAQLTRMNKITEKMLILFGDYAYDYKDLFTKFGYLPQVKFLGWGGMYQFIKVIKTK